MRSASHDEGEVRTARLLSRRLACLAAAGLAGCSVLPKTPYVEQTQWPLIVKRPETLPRRPNGPVLAVRDVTPAPGLDQRGLQWLLPNGSVHVDFYNQWAVPPAQAVTMDLQQWLAASGLFSGVVAVGSGLTPDLELDATLSTFIADPRVLTAHAALALVLIDAQAIPAKVLLQRTVSADAHMTTDTPEGIVDALRAALADALRMTEATLASLPAVRGGATRIRSRR
jgi:cholesterol transport system auxiliary component